MAEKRDLLRYAVKSGQIVIDWGQKMQGRGAYTHRNVICIEKFLDKKRLAHAFKGAAAALSQKDLESLYSELLSQV